MTSRLRRSIGVLLAAIVSTVTVATVFTQPASASSPAGIVNYGSGMCLQPLPDAFQSIYDNNVRIAQMPCDGSPAQLWQSFLLGEGRDPLYCGGFGCPVVSNESYYYVVNYLTGLCLDVRGASTADGAVIQQYACNGGGSEKWFKHPYSFGLTQYVNSRTAKCLDIPNATTSATYIWQYRCTSSNGAQAFTFPL